MSKITDLIIKQKNDIQQILLKYNELIENNFNELISEIELLRDDLSEKSKQIKDVENLKLTIKNKDEEIKKLNGAVSDNNFNHQNFQNFSMISNLSKQISEKDLELKKYQSQLRLAKKEIESLREKLDIISEKDDMDDRSSLKSFTSFNSYEDHPINVSLLIQERPPVVPSPTPPQTPYEPPIEETINQLASLEKTEKTDTPKEKEKNKKDKKDKVKKSSKHNTDQEPSVVEEETKVVEEEPKVVEEEPTVVEEEPKVVEEEPTVVEEEPKVVEEEEEEEEQDINYYRKKIKGVYYFISDENPPLIYECISENEPGDKAIGQMNEKKAEFY
jgi:hypothetical protein